LRQSESKDLRLSLVLHQGLALARPQPAHPFPKNQVRGEAAPRNARASAIAHPPQPLPRAMVTTSQQFGQIESRRDFGNPNVGYRQVRADFVVPLRGQIRIVRPSAIKTVGIERIDPSGLIFGSVGVKEGRTALVIICFIRPRSIQLISGLEHRARHVVILAGREFYDEGFNWFGGGSRSEKRYVLEKTDASLKNMDIVELNMKSWRPACITHDYRNPILARILDWKKLD